MSTHRSTDAAGARGFLVGLAGGALMLGALSCLTPSTPPPQDPVPRVASPIDQWEARPASEPAQADEEVAQPTDAVGARALAPPFPHPLRPAVSPLRFLGRMNTGTESTLVLFASGKTLKVNGPGPIEGSEYVVDDVQERFLVVRDARDGTSQVVDLMPPVQATSNWSPEDSAQD